MSTSTSDFRLEQLLKISTATQSGLVLYQKLNDPPEHLSYRHLLELASANAHHLRQQHGILPGRILLVHFQSHWENIIWFWTTVLASCVPAMSTLTTDVWRT